MRELSKAEEIARGLLLFADRDDGEHGGMDVGGWHGCVLVEIEPYEPQDDPFPEDGDEDRVPRDQQVAWLMRVNPSLHEHHVRLLYELGWSWGQPFDDVEEGWFYP